MLVYQHMRSQRVRRSQRDTKHTYGLVSSATMLKLLVISQRIRRAWFYVP